MGANEDGGSRGSMLLAVAIFSSSGWGLLASSSDRRNAICQLTVKGLMSESAQRALATCAGAFSLHVLKKKNS